MDVSQVTRELRYIWKEGASSEALIRKAAGGNAEALRKLMRETKSDAATVRAALADVSRDGFEGMKPKKPPALAAPETVVARHLAAGKTVDHLTGYRGATVAATRARTPEGDSLITDLKAALLDPAPSLVGLLSRIALAPFPARYEALTDPGFRAELKARMPNAQAACLTGLLMERTLTWARPPTEFSTRFVAERAPQALTPNGSANCGEMVLYAAHMAGRLDGERIFDMYRAAMKARDAVAGTESLYRSFGYRGDLPTYPETTPKPGQILFLSNKETGEKLPSHVVLSLGGSEGLSLWRNIHDGELRADVVHVKDIQRELGHEFTIRIADPGWEKAGK